MLGPQLEGHLSGAHYLSAEKSLLPELGSFRGQLMFVLGIYRFSLTLQSQPTTGHSSNRFVAMDPQQNLPRLPYYVKFRVLIIGRANAGKTSILQRVCDTTESPEIYRRDKSGNDNLVRSRFH